MLEKPLKANTSFFLLGPRGVGKTAWVKHCCPDALYIDLLKSRNFNQLFAEPDRLAEMIPEGFDNWIILDEVQKIPQLLDEVHRQIETNQHKFILTGSSARSLRKKGVNLLAGRARTYHMYPLTAYEMGSEFNLELALKYGMLPTVYKDSDPLEYLASYVETYLEQEVKAEGLTRNLSNFVRFLESASFSQGSVLNISAVARDAGVHRKTVNDYFDILEDLLIAKKIPIFTKRAKRKMLAHPKFYFFDVGIYQSIKPKGPLDIYEEADGIGLESLFLQELTAVNAYLGLDYKLYYWRTSAGQEVDFVLYGEHGLIAIEVKRTSNFARKDLKNLKIFKEDYPMAKTYFVYGGQEEACIEGVNVVSYGRTIENIHEILQKS